MQPKLKTFSMGTTIGLALGAIASFHLAYSVEGCQIFFVAFFYFLLQMARSESARESFYLGLFIGMAIYAPHLGFFWTLFKQGAIALWLILSLWLALFLLLGWKCADRFGFVTWGCIAPVIWLGLEFFRSELYYLRFSWLNAGYAFSTSKALPFVSAYGVYGVGFVLMSFATIIAVFPLVNWRGKIATAIGAAILAAYPMINRPPESKESNSLRVTGVQLEFPSLGETLSGLDKAFRAFPDTDLFVLSEYTFTGPVPKPILKWCQKNGKYLAVGAEEPATASAYYNTVFVINPKGQAVFRQAKCVPVQFMKDGLAATNQSLWDSPWGKLGFGICYDASYTRVTDELVRQGAQGLIFPTMDIQDWGLGQHQLHARVAPFRAAEHEVPIFRLCSSGISQSVASSGRVLQSVGFPGQGEIINNKMQLVAAGRIPPDRWLARLAVVATLLLTVLVVIPRRPDLSSPPTPSK